MSDAPEVSVVVAVYLSETTLSGFLDALGRQTFRNFETILVDSGPTDACARVVAARFETGEVVVGALACHGSRWLDRGIHLCKFSKWLPAGARRAVDMSPTANMLLPRALFEKSGRFHGDMLMGDTTLSRDLLAAGRTLLFEPRAVVEHHHLETVGLFVRERWSRGIRFGRLRGSWMRDRKTLLSGLLFGSLLPLRIVSNVALCARHAAGAGELGTFLATLPVVLLGFSASILGEGKGYAEALFGAPRGSDSS